MCQLTLLDFDPKTFISRTFVRSLTELNAYGWSGKNNDGFGYMTFTKPGEIVKSNLDSMIWWRENERKFLRSVRNANGIYHVRMASNNIKEVHEKDAHPFRAEDIVLAHNGTLAEKSVLKQNEELQKLFEVPDEKAPMIDSEKFTRILANTVGNAKLTATHIKLAMEWFTGPFCFLIFDIKQPKNVFIIRGKDRTLHLAEFFDGKKPIGIALNTGKSELIYWSKIVKMAMAQYNKLKLNIRVSELPQEKVWKYRLGTYKLDKPVAEIKQNAFETVVYHHGKQVNRHFTPAASKNTTTDASNPVYMDLVNMSQRLGLYLREVLLMSEIIFGQALHVLDEESLKVLLKIMEYLEKQNFKGRKKEWNAQLAAKKIDPIKAYKETGLEFPYMFSSKKQIRRAFGNVKEKK